jgi:hypothetical protein
MLAYDEVLGEIDLDGHLLLTDEGAKMLFDMLNERLGRSLHDELFSQLEEVFGPPPTESKP